MSATKDLTIEQGATWAQSMNWKTGDPSALVDLTGYTARMQLREKYGGPLAIELTTENGRITLGGALGTIDLLISATDTATIKARDYVYDLEMISGATVTRLIEGKITVTPEATV